MIVGLAWVEVQTYNTGCRLLIVALQARTGLHAFISGGYFTYCRLYIVALNRRTKFCANISIHDWIIITF